MATTMGMFDSHTSASLEDFEHDERRAYSPELQFSPTFKTSASSAGDASAPSAPPSAAPSDAHWSLGRAAGRHWSPPAGAAPPPRPETSNVWSPSGRAHHRRGDSPQSPTGWRGQSALLQSGAGWYRHQPYGVGSAKSSPVRASTSGSRMEGSRSREPTRRMTSVDDEDLTLPANIPLPRGSMSPEKETRDESPRKAGGVKTEPLDEMDEDEKESEKTKEGGIGNYIRFAFRAEVQHRTEPLEWLVARLHPSLDRAAKRRLSISLWLLLVMLVVWPFLTRTPTAPPSPDMVKLAGLARSLEPLMYYSENGVQHLAELQETGVAVWDLGESVRVANMSGAPTIVRELDDLAESLQALSVQLTQFFPAVDSDIDNVLLVMEWAKRELATLHGRPPSRLESAVANVHTLANGLGLLEDKRTGTPTVAGSALMWLFGMTPAQRARATLHRTFHELLGALEESINTELARTAALFALFATIDGQFRNLQRFTVRELDEQERQETELLGSLWQRVVGRHAARIRKFEKNRHILQSVRSRTVANKNLLVEHNGKLLALKESLETLRRRLMSPLMQGYGASPERASDASADDAYQAGARTGGAGAAASPQQRKRPWAPDGPRSSATLEDQIRGLDETHTYLRGVRQSQRGKVMEALYGSGNRDRGRRMEIEGL